MTPATRRPTLRGVVFDMDGTLTIPNLDFDEMYRRCNVSRSEDILAAVSTMDATQAAEAQSIIEEMEEEGRRTLRLMPGAIELGRWLHGHGIPTSLVTRNTKRTVSAMMENLWIPAGGTSFEPILSRDSSDSRPPKPHPASLQDIAKSWSLGLPSKEILMVGDSPSHDVAFGKAAGVSTALLDSSRRFSEGKDDGGADFVVKELWELPCLLWETFEVNSPLGTGVPLKYCPKPRPRTKAAIAAVEGDLDTLMTLSDDELCATDETGNTPLIWAADAGRCEAVAALIKVPNMKVNARGYLGSTAVCRASRWGHVELIRCLRTVGKADLDIPNDKMQYPLHFAAFKKHAEAVKVLLELGASTVVLDRKGRTPAEDTSDEEIRVSILQARKGYCN
eukprot:CAMPEP_0197457196 /NCGR_PEP_ID=MMETSP1175-20131217/45372_1 /TAXON_ID=1003142 /ORGANISM="Triceratium dubium, Strain CCMP147" /LENGTH=391 /DNA_ID=CAMNT_0042991481 /DNA_START=227 /DNA_END=1402 /DNA_ORIENTATION=+